MKQHRAEKRENFESSLHPIISGNDTDRSEKAAGIQHFCVVSNRNTPMVEWLRFSTLIHKVLCSNLSIITYSMTLDKSLTAKLSRITHSCCANISSVSTLDERGADTNVRKKKKTVEAGCM